MIETKTYTEAEWNAEGERLFGKDRRDWVFTCPVCKHQQSVKDYQDAGATEGEVAFSCIGRRIDGAKDAFVDEGKGPCTYAGGGLFKLNPITITRDGAELVSLFAFAEERKQHIYARMTEQLASDFTEWTLDHWQHFGCLPGTFVYDDDSGTEHELTESEVEALHAYLGHTDWKMVAS